MKQTKTSGKSRIALAIVLLAIISCGGGKSDSQISTQHDGNNGNENHYFDGTPFDDLDDFVAQIEQFKLNQLMVYNDDIDSFTIFGEPTSTSEILFQSSTAISSQKTNNGDFLLDFQGLYLMQNDFSVICIYKFLETNNLEDQDNYSVKSGILLGRYIYSESQQQWIYSGDSQVYSYDYLSENIEDHRIITTTFSSEFPEPGQIFLANTSPAMAKPLSAIDIQNFLNEEYVRKGIEYLRVLPDIIIQVDYFKKDSALPAGTITECTQIVDWRKVNHLNVRIWVRPRGDGSAKDSLDKTKMVLAPHVYLEWFKGYNPDPAKAKNPGYMFSNWHIGTIKGNDGKVCWLLGETNWPWVNSKVPGTIPDNLINQYSKVMINGKIKYNCVKVCGNPKDEFPKIPWLPWKMNIPDPILNRMIQEINNHAPRMVPVAEWIALALASAATPTIITSLENIGNILWSGSDMAALLTEIGVAISSRTLSIIASPKLIIIKMPFMEWVPDYLDPGFCHPDLATENGCVTQI